MQVFKANITPQVTDYLDNLLDKITHFQSANEQILETCGIQSFFNNQEEFASLKDILSKPHNIFEEPEREEYGDFQTNLSLANKITEFLKVCSINPKIIVEPTCGKGNFIIASLKTFKRVKKIFAVEIYKPYVWETKFKILQFFIDNPSIKKPDINIYHFNVFDFDFTQISGEWKNEEVLILGNPPWVTNSKLSSLESNNLPAKSNFKKHSGFDAITGKGNFDIGEYITLMMFNAFQRFSGHFAFLVKNSVIKNVVFDQRQRHYRISDLQKLSIDSKKEFNVSVEASLLLCKLNQESNFTCTEYTLSEPSTPLNEFGWVRDKFVSSISLYANSNDIDGVSCFEWRQGIKHDLSGLMELEKINGHFINGLNQEISLEEGLVFGLLKSSDLKKTVIDTSRKFTIITQKKVGQDTTFIKKEYPLTYHYLNKNKIQFNLRKSSIYKGKPDFSIFGIGEYSFKPFKITISGLYKNYFFNLILPQNGKPLMVDDTCYLLGFDKLEFAAYTLILLNSEKVKKFLQAITFTDAKRVFTKDILMRIDLSKLAMQFSGLKIQDELDDLNIKYKLKIQLNMWNEYMKTITSQQKEFAFPTQLTLLESKAKYKRKVI